MITIEWGTTFIINVPQSYLTLVSGTIYELDTEQFRLDLKALEATFDGMAYTRTHDQVSSKYTISGTTYANAFTIIPPYSIQFENGLYSVILRNTNNNIADVADGILVQNQVQVIPNNSAGLVIGGGGDSVWTETEKDKVIQDSEEGKDWARKASDNAEQANLKL